MSEKSLKRAVYQAAAMAMLTPYYDSFYLTEGKRIVPKKVETDEDRERRERCEKKAIEAARLKRERKAKKYLEIQNRKKDE